MTTHRRYVFQTKLPEGHSDALGILRHACERHWWYNDPEVNGAPYGVLSLEFTVSGRDQWWCHKRAMRLATDAYYAIGLTERDLPEPMWETLEPHTNRGRYRIPKDQ